MTDDLVSHLRKQFVQFGDSRRTIFLTEHGRQMVENPVSYAELDRRAREIAVWLRDQPHGDQPVLLLFEPGRDFWEAFLGTLYAGMVAIPAPLPHDGRSMQRVASILRNANASLALTSSHLQNALDAGITHLDLPRTVRVSAINDAQANAGDWEQPELSPDHTAFLQYTSGSTGDPKGVMVTHGNIISNETSIATTLNVGSNSVVVGWIPHFHDMGLIGHLLGYFVAADVVVMSPLAFLKQPVRMLQAISNYGGTISAAPNFAYDMIARRVTAEQVASLDLSSWQVALNGAEPVRRRTIERLTDLLAPAGFPVSAPRPAFGMAEVTLLATASRGANNYLAADPEFLEQNRYFPTADSAITLVSSGPPAVGVDVRIVDPETRVELDEDRVGEIWLRGTSVTRGYYGRTDETRETFEATTVLGDGPFLRTGDLGLIHDGELYVTGRRKDVLIINGRNLYPQDIEGFVQDLHPAIGGSRGVAISTDIDGTEQVVLIQAISPERLGSDSFDHLTALVRTAIARHFEIPAPIVVFVRRTGIHLTTSGKVQRSSMRAAFLKSELTEVLHQSTNVAAPPLVHSGS